jgi:hypothetical protein
MSEWLDMGVGDAPGLKNVGNTRTVVCYVQYFA